MTKKKGESNTFALNAVIGFLSILLFILLTALVTRIVYPRIQNQRAEQQTELIGKIIQIEVLNGCGVSGMAMKFTSALRKNGFDVVETGNFETFDIEETLVISRTENLENARRVARALGVPDKNILMEASDDFYLDATVVIGSDYKTLNIN
ncbi:MAG: LytR C-terminal domain-containing protein [Balneolaceae bacterium]|nr:LytR C-terminal domain-containing protein [Balneolaceae bacterium]